MSYWLRVFIAVAVVFVFMVSVVVQVGAAEPQLTPEQQDVVNLLQRESAEATNRARQAELALSRAQRELAASKAECQPKKDEKK